MKILAGIGMCGLLCANAYASPLAPNWACEADLEQVGWRSDSGRMFGSGRHSFYAGRVPMEEAVTVIRPSFLFPVTNTVTSTGRFGLGPLPVTSTETFGLGPLPVTSTGANTAGTVLGPGFYVPVTGAGVNTTGTTIGPSSYIPVTNTGAGTIVTAGGPQTGAGSNFTGGYQGSAELVLAVPEPASGAVIGGLGMLFLSRRRSR